MVQFLQFWQKKTGRIHPDGGFSSGLAPFERISKRLISAFFFFRMNLGGLLTRPDSLRNSNIMRRPGLKSQAI